MMQTEVSADGEEYLSENRPRFELIYPAMAFIKNNATEPIVKFLQGDIKTIEEKRKGKEMIQR